MNISEIFIRRPVMTALLMLAMLFYGLFAYHALPVSDLPDVDFPTISVSASLPGASPETMASSVATPLEKQFSTIESLETLSSVSSLGQTQLTLQFNINRNIDSAALDVQTAITSAIRQLPREMPYPPTFRKVNPSAAPILYLALTSDTLPLSTVNLYAETLLAQRLSMISGVARVNVFGSKKYAVRIQIDPDKLFYNGLGLDEVAQTIAQNNVNLPTGIMDSKDQSYLIRVDGQLQKAASFAQLPIAYSNSGILKLKDVATVTDSSANSKTASWHNGKPAIVLALERQPGANSVAVIDEVNRILPQFKQQLPANVALSVVYDRSVSIRDSIYEVQHALIIAALLVIVIIFLFLRNTFATLIPAMALCLSVIGTFAFMYLLKFSLNNITLLALMLSVGYVIDDAIVMLENIFRYREQGESAWNAALKGSRQVSFTILSITFSLVAVFIPVLFMGGLIGRLLFEFGVTIAIAILLSGIVALTLTPMMASRLISGKPHEDAHAWQRRIETAYRALAHRYDLSLQWALKHHRFIFLSFILTFIASLALFYFIPKGFLPSEDTGQLFAYTEADPSVSFSTMVERQQILANILRADSNIDSVVSSVGAGGASSSVNAGRFFLRLKPSDERAMTADELTQSLRKKLAVIPGITAYVQNVPSIRIGNLSKSPYQLTMQSGDLDELYKWAAIYGDKMRKLPGFQDVTSDLQYAGPQIDITLLRDKMSALFISAMRVENTLAFAYGSQLVSTLYKPEDTYDVIMELLPAFRENPEMLSHLRIRSDKGALVPLKEVADINLGKGLLAVNHVGQLPAVTISFNLDSNTSLSEALTSIAKIKNSLSVPTTVITSFQGTAEVFQKSVAGMGLLLLISILTMYIVLGILYESFIHPLTILSGLPAAAVGALITLMLCGIDLNIYSFIGIIMLIGIVKKNAIMMIDFALDAQRNENKSPADAIYHACLVRFRPIMMTTLAALVGVLPIVFSTGAGSETRRPLGLAVMGGLVFSQFLTLYITPVIYLYMEKLRGHHNSNSAPTQKL